MIRLDFHSAKTIIVSSALVSDDTPLEETFIHGVGRVILQAS